MKARQFVTPVLIRNGTATVLRHVPLDERTFKEADLQALLFAHPTLIPVGDIEPIFDRLHPLARELRVGSGFIDLVFMNDEGYLTLVETKLWRNPEARRTVVAQLIDYASHVSTWTYNELRQAVLDSRKGDALASGYRDMDPAGLQLNREQDVERNQTCGSPDFGGEEIGSGKGVPVTPKKLPPRRPSADETVTVLLLQDTRGASAAPGSANRPGARPGRFVARQMCSSQAS